MLDTARSTRRSVRRLGHLEADARCRSGADMRIGGQRQGPQRHEGVAAVRRTVSRWGRIATVHLERDRVHDGVGRGVHDPEEVPPDRRPTGTCRAWSRRRHGVGALEGSLKTSGRRVGRIQAESRRGRRRGRLVQIGAVRPRVDVSCRTSAPRHVAVNVLSRTRPRSASAWLWCRRRIARRRAASRT